MTFDDFSKKLWQGYIEHKINCFLQDGNIKPYVSLKENAKKIIYRSYMEFNQKIHNTMHDDKSPIDRHKVSAAMTCAILQTSPLEVTNLQNPIPMRCFNLNNELAFNSGLYLLKSFVDTNLDLSFRPVFPKAKTHGNFEYGYEVDFYKLLFYMKTQENYDINLLSHKSYQNLRR